MLVDQVSYSLIIELLLFKTDSLFDLTQTMFKLLVLLLVVCYINSCLVATTTTDGKLLQRHQNHIHYLSPQTRGPTRSGNSQRPDRAAQDEFTLRPSILRDVFRTSCNQQTTTSLVLFTKPNSAEQGEVRVTRFTDLAELQGDDSSPSGFNPRKQTYLIIHGFRGCSLADQSFIVDMKELILRKKQANVFYVDWNHHANTFNYIKSVNSMAEVAGDIFEILKGYELAYPGFKKQSVRVIGHSLGAHVAGQLGRLMMGQMEQIIGLDPAGVELVDASPSAKLTIDDAKYVTAYHTNARNYGTRLNLADRDIYFNDGNEQPSCTSSVALLKNTCSHRMATAYLSVRMGKCTMMAYRCQSIQGFLSGHCGFCRSGSSDCVPAGLEWQYDIEEAEMSDFSRAMRESAESKRRQQLSDVPWSNNQSDSKYFVETSSKSPYCAFNYQIVVKFSDKFNSSQAWFLDIDIRKDSRVKNKLTVDSMNKISHKSSITVFDSQRGKTKKITGYNLFIGLLIIDPYDSFYKLMPQRLNQVTIRSPEARDAQAQVYLNYMSHFKFDTRAAMSGPANINWDKLER